jgi:hypothetical protein
MKVPVGLVQNSPEGFQELGRVVLAPGGYLFFANAITLHASVWLPDTLTQIDELDE